MPKIFFASYARKDNDAGLLRGAVGELSSRVRANLGLNDKPEDLVFFDTTHIKTGTQWEEVLGDALRTIRVLVCMCSPTSLNSEYCAKEFELFRRRIADAGNIAHGKVVIIPVIWERGAPPMTLPGVIAELQATDDRLPSGYKAHGLARLARFESQKQTYVETLEVLAEIISTAYAEAPLTDWPHPVSFEELPRWYHRPEDGRFNLAVSVLHPDGTQWRPGGGLRSIGATVDRVADSLGIAWRELQADAAIALSIDGAKKQGHGVLFVVDASTVAKPPFSTYLGLLDATPSPTSAFVIGMASASPSAAEFAAEIQRLVPAHSQAGCVSQVFSTTNSKTLEDALTQTAAGLQVAHLNVSPGRAVESDQLMSRALAGGFAPTSAPILAATPPGAT